MDSKPKFILKTPIEEKPSFSKSILGTIVFLYFVGAILGTILVVVSMNIDLKLGNGLDTSMFMAYAAYIGGPTATAIGFYAWKSKAENVLKIGKSFDKDMVEVVSRLED